MKRKSQKKNRRKCEQKYKDDSETQLKYTN